MKHHVRTIPPGRAGGTAAVPSFVVRLFVAAALMLLASIAPASASPMRVDSQVRDQINRYGSARVIVKMAESALSETEASGLVDRPEAIHRAAQQIAAAAPHMLVARAYRRLPLLAGAVDSRALDELDRLPEVEAVFPDRPMQAVLNESGPLVGQPEAEAAGLAGAGVGIAIIDTGVDYTHPALGGAAVTQTTDVKPGYWAWQQIEAAFEHSIVTGFPDGSYQPTSIVTRDQMAVFIARGLAGGDSNVPTFAGTPSFPDVPADYWASNYIEYCKAHGIVEGLPDGTYGPTLQVGRGDMAVFVARAIAGGDANVPAGPSQPTFPDVTQSSTWAWAYRYVEYIDTQGVAHGYSDGLYHPEILCGRDQMAVFVTRAFHLTWSGRVIGGINLLAAEGSVAADDPMDDEGHGTMNAGIAASADPVYRGMAPDANLLAVKVLDRSGNGLSSDVLAGMDWCIQNQVAFNIKAMNLSIGDTVEWPDYVPGDPNNPLSQPESIAVTEAVNAGILVAAASGNEGFTQGINLPAASIDAVSVAATKDGGPEADAQPVDGIASYSDRGDLVSMYAPGSVITCPVLGGGLASGEGTSFSSPHIAGAAAVMVSARMTDPREIRARLMRTGVQIVDPVTNVATPRLDLARAIAPPTTGPDLIVTAVSIANTSPRIGDHVSVTLTVQNQGTVASDPCTAIVVLSANSVISPQDSIIASVAVPQLAPMASFTPPGLTGIIPAIPLGTYLLGGYVDSTYVVAELDETNNALAGAVVTVSGM
jgi:subtilisin family serine protease